MSSVAPHIGIASPINGTVVEILSCTHNYGDYVALRDVTLRLRSGELVTLLGPSGSGKTTLLRTVAGLILPTRGTIRISGKDVTHLPAEKRDVGMVFQNYALFPHLNVFENVAFPLRVRREAKREIRMRVEEALELVGLAGLGQRFPMQLSGGQQQRVALARAIIFRPRLLLMDEPLGSLDKRLKQQLQVEFRRLQKDVQITAIYVTHDQDEAFAISDRIAVMDSGTILQLGSPSEIYREPANRFVADFVGDFNWFQGTIHQSKDGLSLRTSRGLEICVAAGRVTAGAHIACGIRPERVVVGNKPCRNLFPARLQTVRVEGSRCWGEAVLPTGDSLIVELDENMTFREGDQTQVGWNVEDMHLFACDAGLEK